MPLPTQQRLNDHLIRWDREIRAYDEAVHAYGEAKADLEHRRAVIKAHALAKDEKLPANRLESIADGDEEAYRLAREFRGSEATIAAKRERLKWCAAVADALRSEISTERAEAQLYAADRSAP